MKNHYLESDKHLKAYTRLPLVKPEKEGAVNSNSNIILKIGKDVNLLSGLIKYSILKHERLFFLILSEEPLLDMEALKRYLIEKDLTEFAKKEILKIAEIISNTVLLNIEYDNLPEPQFFTDYSFTGKNGGTSEGAVNGSLIYIISSKSGIIYSNEDSFRKEYDNMPFFYMVEYNKIFNSFNQLMDLLKLTSVLENIKDDQEKRVKLELHNHIFKGNAFEVFDEYCTYYSISENSKTDLSLLFQLFSQDGLFIETVELKHYVHWLNQTYSYSLMTIKKTNIQSRPNLQRINSYNQIKKATLK